MQRGLVKRHKCRAPHLRPPSEDPIDTISAFPYRSAVNTECVYPEVTSGIFIADQAALRAW